MSTSRVAQVDSINTEDASLGILFTKESRNQREIAAEGGPVWVRIGERLSDRRQAAHAGRTAEGLPAVGWGIEK